MSDKQEATTTVSLSSPSISSTSSSSSSSFLNDKNLTDSSFTRLNKLFLNATLKQVEINTMSAGFGYVSGRVVDLHK